MHIDLVADVPQNLFRLPVQRLGIDQPEVARFASEHDIFAHRHLFHQAQLLMNKRKAHRLGLMGRGEMHFFAIHQHGSARRRQAAG